MPPDDHGLTVQSRRDGEDQVLELLGELDISGQPEIERALRAAEATDAGRIVVDLSRLEFMDSTGLNVLLAARARNDGDGTAGRLRLRGAHGAVLRVLQITGVDELFVADG